jgi:hypothetical protein
VIQNKLFLVRIAVQVDYEHQLLVFLLRERLLRNAVAVILHELGQQLIDPAPSRHHAQAIFFVELSERKVLVPLHRLLPIRRSSKIAIYIGSSLSR